MKRIIDYKGISVAGLETRSMDSRC